jgi:hypothetical protein
MQDRAKESCVKRAPFHSTKLGDGVYHDNDECPDARSMPALYRAEGTGGRPLCKTCARLDGNDRKFRGWK